MYYIESLIKSHHYAKRYEKFIKHIEMLNLTRDLSNFYTEKHHIIPTSLGGSNCKTNLVRLTYREHYIAHIMLYYAYRNWQMANAIIFMSDNKKHKNSKVYEIHRKKAKNTFAEYKRNNSTKGIKKHSEEFKQKMSLRMSGENNPYYGKTHSKEVLEKMSEKIKASYEKLTPLEKDKRSKQLKERFSNPDVRKKMSNSKIGSFSCINKNGEIRFISKEIYESQTGLKNEWEWVAMISYEGKRRKGEAQIECPHCASMSYKMIHNRYHGDKCKKKK